MSVESKPAPDASLGELLTQLSSQTTRLVRDELRLLQKESQEAAKHAGIGTGLLSAAGILALFGAAAVITAAIAALALALPVWAAALIVAVPLFIAAGIAAMVSRRQVEEVSPPRQTVDNVKKDISVLKEARHEHA